MRVSTIAVLFALTATANATNAGLRSANNKDVEESSNLRERKLPGPPDGAGPPDGVGGPGGGGSDGPIVVGGGGPGALIPGQMMRFNPMCAIGCAIGVCSPERAIVIGAPPGQVKEGALLLCLFSYLLLPYCCPCFTSRISFTSNMNIDQQPGRVSSLHQLLHRSN